MIYNIPRVYWYVAHAQLLLFEWIKTEVSHYLWTHNIWQGCTSIYLEGMNCWKKKKN